MDPWLIDFGWLIGSFVFGIFLGCLTGLIPGFHVNNVALIALSLSPVAVGIGIPLDAVAGIIVACGTVHTFLNYIPSALVGAPDDNMALALLPGHRMLISGQAAQGVPSPFLMRPCSPRKKGLHPGGKSSLSLKK